MQTYEIRARIEPGFDPVIDALRVLGRYESQQDAERALARMDDLTYEGWTNKPTWAVGLWINNEQGPYNDVRRFVRDHIEDAGDDEGEARHQVEGAIQSYVEEKMIRKEDASLGSDLLTWALAMVNWRELAESFIRDVKEADEYDAR